MFTTCISLRAMYHSVTVLWQVDEDPFVQEGQEANETEQVSVLREGQESEDVRVSHPSRELQDVQQALAVEQVVLFVRGVFSCS